MIDTKRHYLVVGDPHVVVDELPECERLASFILEKWALCPDDTDLVLLGDLYNNHAVLRIEVIAFWRDFFHKARRQRRMQRVIALVGNHDLPQDGRGSKISSLLTHYDEDNVVVIGTHMEIDPGVWAMPYMESNEAFQAAWADMTQRSAPKLVFCHQTFAGAKYENGFFAPDGMPLEAVHGPSIISGHIHSPQRVGNVWYPGAPRWRILTDANVDRFIHLVRYDHATGEVSPVDAWATDAVCTPIRLATVTTLEEAKALQAAPGLRVTISGSESFVKEAEGMMATKGIKFRSTVSVREEAGSPIRESDGIPQAFQSFWKDFEPPFHTPKDVLQGVVAKRLRL